MDSDGQHKVEDAIRICDACEQVGGLVLDLALQYLQLGVLNKTPEKILPALPEFAKIIGSLRDPAAIRRWTYLASFLSTFAWEYAKTARKDGSDNVEFNI